MAIGLVINWGVALYALLFSADELGIEIDPMGFFLTIPVWPLTLYNIISSFFERD